ncbi:MAG TPA: GNAT family N-acetyltransferase [Acidimicrobiia bacterium]|nr:GNAT family N-acetyltransferase [Acidimicrobiia bacterium]
METARAATSDDLDTIVALARAMRAELHELRGGALWETREARPEPLASAFEQLLTRADTCVAIGTIDGTPVGFGVVEIEALRDGTTLGVISELFVDAGARDVGVGESIAARLVEFCQSAGCAGIDATALPGHREAKNFFERSGFTARKLTMHRRL